MDDMEKRGLIALAVSLGFLLLWSSFFAPPPPPPAEPDVEAPAELVEAPVSIDLDGDADAGATSGASEQPAIDGVAAAMEEEFVVRTDQYEVTLTNRGGRVVSWRLLGYVDDQGAPVELVPPESREMDLLPLSIWVPGREDLTKRADGGLFRIEREPVSGGGKLRGERIRMRYAEPSGFVVEKMLLVSDGSYFVEASISLREGGRELPAWLMWGAGFGESAEGNVKATRFQSSGGVVVDRGGKVSRWAKDGQDEAFALNGPADIHWAGMETTYFAALMIPAAPTRQAAVLPSQYHRPSPGGTEDGEEKPIPFLSLALASGETAPGEYLLFVGPKDYRMLRAAGNNLKGVINFGWPVVREIAQGLYLALTWVYGYLGNYGLAILTLTFFIRVGFFPLMYSTQIKMRHMQQKTKRIQPKMKAVRERYRKQKADVQSRQKMNEEIMALYKKEGVNPLGGLGGCLPLLLQLPFLYGFYQLLNVTIELRQAPFFGWIHDLSLPDPYYVTPLLMGVSMLVQTKISMSSAVDPNQRRMMTMMSVVFTVFFLNLPSGLVLYWFFSNLLGIGQQVLVNRRADQELELQKPQKGSKSSNKQNRDKTRKARAASRP